MKNAKPRVEKPLIPTIPPSDLGASGPIVRRHLRFGWWCLLLFLSLGIVLEGFHGFKVGAYLNPSQATRRLLWTLAHAHGALLGMLNLGFAFSVSFYAAWDSRRRNRASACLMGASVLLPAGFFLGGINIRGGDPGLGILLVPLGAGLLLAAVLMTAVAATRDRPPNEPAGKGGGPIE